MDLSVGQKASRSLTLTAEQVEKYAEITRDYNPLHFDEAFAAGTKFGKLVVQGGLTTGILNALVAMDMPGPGTVFLSHDFKFVAPVFIGVTITGGAALAPRSFTLGPTSRCMPRPPGGPLRPMK